MNLYNIKLKASYFLSNTMMVITGEKKRSKKKILEYKDRYKGEVCFVIGNGPSLIPSDLDALKMMNISTFASNSIYKVFDRTTWRPTYYGIFDESIASKECIKNNTFICDAKFFRSQGWLYYHKIKDGIYINSFHSRKYLDNPKFSEDLTEGLYTIGTVTYALLQIAKYMGFSEIYLLGMDNRYKYGKTKDGKIYKNEDVVSHYGDIEVDEKSDLPKDAPAIWELDTAYEYADKYSRSAGFRIYNATRGGYLEKFDRVDFDSVIKNLEVNNENSSINSN